MLRAFETIPGKRHIADALHGLSRLLKSAVVFSMKIARASKGVLQLSDFAICLIGALLGLCIGLFVLRGFLFSHGLAAYWDLDWLYSSSIYPHYTWDEFAQAPIIINRLPVFFPLSLFSAEVGERLLFLSIFTVMGLSMFFATFKLTYPRHKTAKVPLLASGLATLLFVFNPIICEWVWYWEGVWFYAFLPLLLYFSYTAFRDVHSLRSRGFIKKAILIALVLFLMSFCPRMPLFFPIFLLAFLAGFSRPWIDYLKRSVVLIGLTLLFYAVFSAFWLIPTALASDFVPYWYVTNRFYVQAASANCAIFDVFSLQAYPVQQFFTDMFWHSGLAATLWQAAVISFPVIAFASILFRRSKLIIWLVIFALVFIFLGKGTNPPFGGFYEWFVFDSPVLSSIGYQVRKPFFWHMPLVFCYAILVGFTISYFLGWLRDKSKWFKLRKGLFILFSVVFLAIPLGAGYPLLTGDIHGTMKPKVLSDVRIELYQWLKDNNTGGKALVYPSPWRDGMPIPKTPYYYSGMNPSRSPLYPEFLRQSRKGTVRMGELMSVFNGEYLVADALRGGGLSEFPPQEDTELIQQIGPYNVFKNDADHLQLEASARTVAVLGGLEHAVSLAAIESFDFSTFPLIFLDQLIKNGDSISSADILVSGQANLDLYLSKIDEEYIIKPADFVNKNPSTFWFQAPIHFLQSYLKQATPRLENWQHDYGEWIVLITGPTQLNMSFKIDQPGDYDVFMRCLQNGHGADGIRVSVDGEIVGDVRTESQVTEFVWREVGTVSLQGGSHTVAMEDIRGFNVVNLIAVLPSGELERCEEQAVRMLEDKRVIYIWEAETAMNYSGWVPKSTHPNPEAEIVEYGGEASNGAVVRLADGSRAWRDIDVIRSDEYMVGVRMGGSGEISIDGDVTPVSSSELGFEYVGPVHLDQGGHSLEVSAKGGQVDLDVVWLYSVEDGVEEVGGIFKAGVVTAEVVSYEKVNPTKYKVRVNASEPFMLAFAEMYDRMWVACANGVEYESMILNAMVNGFWIEDTGDLEITIEFKPQTWFYWGVTISIIGQVGALAFVLWDWRRKRK